MRIEIKQATIKDAEAISNIYALSWKAAYQGMVPQKYLDDLQNDFWVSAFHNWITDNSLKAELIYENSIPVGCIAYGKSRDKAFAKWGEIVSIYIHPDHFKKGFGQKLLDIALLDMKKDGYTNCYLWVLKDNKNAQYFYEKNKFRCNHDECKCEIMGEFVTDLRYVVNLAN